MVHRFESRDVTGEYCHACRPSKAINFYIPVIVQNVHFCSLIDSWDLNKQDKQVKFRRQAVQGNLFHLSKFLRQVVFV